MWTNSPLALLELEVQTDDAGTPLRSRPKTFCVAARAQECSEGRNIVLAGPKAVSSWDFTRLTGLSGISVYQLELAEQIMAQVRWDVWKSLAGGKHIPSPADKKISTSEQVVDPLPCICR
jgi:hypothetical protein